MNPSDPRSRVFEGSHERFSDTLDRLRLAAQNSEQSLTLKEVVDLFGPKGHVLLILFLNLPFCQPIPIPGVSTALGLCMMIVAYFMVLDQPPWIPKRLSSIKIEKRFLTQISSRLEALMKKLEKFVRPRGQAYFAKQATRVTTGVLLSFHAALLSLPLPIPFSNFFPALVLMLLCLGTLEEDMVVTALGYVAVIACAVFFAALVVLPYMAVKAASQI